MSDVLTNLTALAVLVFRKGKAGVPESELLPSFLFSRRDGVLEQLHRVAHISRDQRSEITDAVPKVFSEPEFAPIIQKKDDLFPMVLSAAGGSRMDPVGLLSGLFSSAAMQILFLDLRDDEATFVRTVLDNFEELRRAARGERVRAHWVTGIAGVQLPSGTQAGTPWGVLRPAPNVADDIAFMRQTPRTSCILAESRLVTVKFDPARQPEHEFDPDERRSTRAHLLFPLACALASSDTAAPAGPIETWSTFVLPFQGGFGYSQSTLPDTVQAAVNLEVSDLEEWARTIEAAHSPTVDIAATRLVSAVARRRDRVDALIDAVMVWENLLGTSTEVTFRVTAALAKSLEPDPSRRSSLRKSLADIYGIRSRIIHGAAVEQSKANDAARQAIDAAVRILRQFYRRGPGWLALPSHERADAILLEET